MFTKFIVALQVKHAMAQNRLAQLRDDDRGVTSMEYGVIAVATVAGIGTIIGTIGTDLTTLFTKIEGYLK